MFEPQSSIEPITGVRYLCHEDVGARLDINLDNVDRKVDQYILASLWDRGEVLPVSLGHHESSTILFVTAIDTVFYRITSPVHRNTKCIVTGKLLSIAGMQGQVCLVRGRAFIETFFRVVVNSPSM